MSTPKWFQQAKPTCSIVPIRRFVTDSVFALKNGGYGCMFALDGIDDEGLTDEVVADAIRRVQGALKSVPEHGRLYQYARIRRGFDVPRQEHYSNPRVEMAVRDRITFLNETANFRRIELFWVVTVEPARKNSRGSTTLSPQQFERQTCRSIAQTERTAEMLTVQLEDLLGLRLLRQDEAVSFWAYLLNLEPWALATKLASQQRVDRQLVRSSIQWGDEHLRIGKQYVQLFSLLDSPGGSRPNLFGVLQSIDANMILCSQWIPRSRNDVQKRIGQLEGFAGIFRHRLLAVAANMRSPQNLEKSVRAKAADKGSDKLADVLNSIDNEGHDFGEYSFFGWFIRAISRKYLRRCPLLVRRLLTYKPPLLKKRRGAFPPITRCCRAIRMATQHRTSMCVRAGCGLTTTRGWQ